MERYRQQSKLHNVTEQRQKPLDMPSMKVVSQMLQTWLGHLYLVVWDEKRLKVLLCIVWNGRKKSVESYVKEQNINSLLSFKHVRLVGICLSFQKKCVFRNGCSTRWGCSSVLVSMCKDMHLIVSINQVWSWMPVIPAFSGRGERCRRIKSSRLASAIHWVWDQPKTDEAVSRY